MADQGVLDRFFASSKYTIVSLCWKRFRMTNRSQSNIRAWVWPTLSLHRQKAALWAASVR